MPTYEYRCETCGTFEVYQGIKEPPLTACPTCGRPVRRIISKGGGVIFKGSGFYETDYRSSEYKERAKSDAPAAPKETGGSEGKGAAPSAGSPGPSGPGETGGATGPAGSSGSKPGPGA